MGKKQKSSDSYAVCIENEGFSASLEVRKLYRIIPDEADTTRGMIRVVDESGDDYLYPADWFIPVDLAAPVRRALAATA